MREYFKLTELWIGGKDNEPKSNIYVSEDFTKNKNKCMVLIQGTGRCRPGVWAVDTCMYQGITTGSMFPMLEYARQNGFSVIVLNPNMAKDPCSGASIPHCKSKVQHCNYVWETFISKKADSNVACAADKLAIVAFSAAGKSMASWFDRYRT